MAAVHRTATAYNNFLTLPANHIGLNVVYGEISATLCGSGALFLAKIPHGARIIDGWVDVSLGPDYRVGISTPDDLSTTLDAYLIGTTSTTTVARFYTGGTGTTDGVGYKVSLSDDATSRYVFVKMTASGSYGGSPIKYCIQYLTDGQ